MTPRMSSLSGMCTAETASRHERISDIPRVPVLLFLVLVIGALEAGVGWIMFQRELTC